MSEIAKLAQKVNRDLKSNIANFGLKYEYIPRIPFSNPRLNYMTYGGIPMGRQVEFAGPEGSGKTTTALDLVSQAQKAFPDRSVVFLDAERTLDPEWAVKMGVDVDSLLVITPENQSAETLFGVCRDFIETGQVSLMVFDSLATTQSQQQLSKEYDESTMGGISRPLTRFSNDLNTLLPQHGTCFVGINQIRDNMNSPYGGTDTPGGRGWRHNCSVRISFHKGNFIDENGVALSRNCENPAGNLVDVSVVKSKVFPMDRKVGFYTLMYMSGMDSISDLIDVASKEGVLNKAGSWYTVLNLETGEVLEEDGKPVRRQGLANMRKFLEDNTAYLDELNNAVNERFR